MKHRWNTICHLGIACVASLLPLCSGHSGWAAEPAAKVDQISLEQAKSQFERGNLVDAERFFREAVEANKLPDPELGPALERLTRIYRAWGQNDDALKMAMRFREVMAARFPNDSTRRNQMLDKSAADMADILLALDQPDKAEQYLQNALKAAQQTTAADPLRTIALLAKLARLCDAKDQSERAKQTWQRIVDLGSASVKKLASGQLNAALYPEFETDLDSAFSATERQSDAMAVFSQLLTLHVAQRDVLAAIRTRIALGSLATGMGDFNAALDHFHRALQAQHQLQPGSADEADLLSLVAAIYQAQGNDAKVKSTCDDAVEIYRHLIRTANQSAHAGPLKSRFLDQLRIVCQQASRNVEAIAAAQELLDLRRQLFGEKHRLTYEVKSNLGALYGAAQDYEQAKPLLEDAVIYWRTRKPAAPLQLARALNDLAFVERGVGSFDDARRLFQEALRIRQQNLQPDDLRLADTYSNLGLVQSAKGDYAGAVVQLEKAIDIYRRHGRNAEQALSSALLNQAMAYKSQGQLAKALDYCQQALDVFQNTFGPDAPGAVVHLNALASLAVAQQRIAEAKGFVDRALKLCEHNQLLNDPVAATALHQKATIEYLRDDRRAAQEDWQTALVIQKAFHQHMPAARTLNYLAKLNVLNGNPAAAESQFREALALQGNTHTYPTTFYLTSCNLAEILHDRGVASQDEKSIDEAIRLVSEAVKVIETPRGGTIGGESERAEFFSQFASAFDLLVSWSIDLKRIEDAFAYAERGRNRTFLDQLALAGVDLRDTLTGPAAEKLLATEKELRAKLGTLRARAVAITESQPSAAASSDAGNAELMKLAAELDRVESSYAQVWSEIRNASPYYRQQLARDAKLGTLELVREQLAKLNSVMLFYYVGAKKSYLLVIDPAEHVPEVVSLEVDLPLAEAMSIKAGPLTRPEIVKLVNAYLADVRDRAGGRGLSGIVHSKEGVLAADQGTLLSEVLIPRSVRNRIARSAPKSVIIVPDGALHELPFESLLLEREPSPKYLLDVFPPIAYAPSANIFLNLLERSSANGNAVATLTVGNPKYIESSRAKSVIPVASGPADKNSTDGNVAQLTFASVSREAYLGLGGQLPPLPATAKECARIAQAFEGGKVTVLEAEKATERGVRDHIAGCRFLHLAAHGLVDQQHDNLFGAIALTPPAQSVDSAEDDGFLSLHEIHELPLGGCQLAVLSACQTNVGPDRPLEAGSTLAQAFLVAGARRVVCSHWSVDDASTAELIGTLFEEVAQSAKQFDAPGNERHNPISYAAALHEAQKHVRSQPQWSSPYYWAPFVLIGPPQ